MKRLGMAVFCLFALFLMTAAAAERSRGVYVNGKFLIASYNVNGKQVVAFDDLAKLVAGAGNLTVAGGKVMTVAAQPRTMASVMPAARGGVALKIRKAGALGAVLSSGGKQWISLSDLVKQLGGVQAIPIESLAAGAAIQIRVFDCPDVQCCPDCGIAIR